MTVVAGVGSQGALGISLSDARRLVIDLKRPVAWIYWTDLLASVAVGATAFALFPVHDPVSVWAAACVLVAATAFYRAVLFVHELVHAAEGLRGFSLVWHLLVGIPLLVPKFIYEFHREHHASRTYGTAADGEYVDYATGPRWRVLLTPLTAVVGLPVFIARFLVLAPVSWILPGVRGWVLTRGSALAIDAEFVRPLPAGRLPRHWLVQEAACFGYCVLVAVLLATGRIPWIRLAEAYAVITVVLFVNWLRVLASHRYESAGAPMSFPDQILDSVDHTSCALLAELWAPLGLRYHAVHHLFPWLPYHALPRARRRLAAAIPAGGGYWDTADPSLWATLRRLLARTRKDETIRKDVRP
ncbi:fatty acid desaturase [Nocardia pseudobrasiliensis]|uniref:Fatty acid desaturase n=1 Tax=Nocardia pseudobrasiliensis TaxID=45979 RepID=A0A370HWI1_9NOCA|nr:fatty acid desaturase [Nocardia pseudobrasiliensis]RDI61314.1 fatty acid desaturase [Nocardia pseudobrasiliensis]